MLDDSAVVARNHVEYEPQVIPVAQASDCMAHSRYLCRLLSQARA